MAIQCETVVSPDAAPGCVGDDPGKSCSGGCSSIVGDKGIQLVAGQSGSLPSGGYPRPSFGGPNAPVDLSTLLADVSLGGLNQGAMGPGVQLRWSNGMKVGSSLTDIQLGVGLNWSLNLQARLLDLGSNRFVAMFQPTNRGQKFYFEKETDGSFTPLYGCKVELEETSTEYWLMLNGIKVVFYKTGRVIKKIIGSGGVQTDYLYDSDGRLEEVLTKRTDGANHYHNSLVLAYAASGGGGGPGGPGGPGGASVGVSGIIETITQRSYVGTDSSPSDSDYTPMSRMELEIPDSAVSGRCPAGSLYRVKYQTPTVSGGTTTWSTDRTKMFVYATSATTDYFAGAIKYVIDENGYESLSNPDTATDSQLKAASSAFFKYEPSTQRVDYVATHGGELENTITYSINSSTPTDPTNNWLMKAVYTAGDGSEKTVYSNHNHQDMLVVDDDGTDKWIYYTKFDSDGRAIEQYTPESIDMSATPYDDTEDDLDVQIKTSAGRIKTTNWYSTTGSGAAKGRLESNGVKQGSGGTEILLSKVEYGSRSVTESGVTRSVYPVTKTIVYQSDSGGGDPVETTYSYTWHSGTLMPATVTTSLPDVATAKNGVAHPQSDSIVAEYNANGQLTKKTDARGTTTEYEYDEATGAMTKVIQDTGTGNLNIASESVVNERGRVTKTLGPEHDVDGTNIQTVSWSVKVSEYETWSAQGYYDVSADTYTLVNPVSIQKRTDDGSTVDMITAKKGSAVESSGELTDSDSFPQSSWVTWSRNLMDIHGRSLSSRQYFDIPSSGTGTKGTNYTETSVGRDTMNRGNKQVSADGTISRTVFNSRGLPVSTWIGTDDTGATNSDPTGGEAAGNNMVQLQSIEYDGGSEGGNSLTTKVTTMVNSTTADNRITEMEYDWRDRLENTINSDGLHDFHQKPTLDNLGRNTANKMYRDDSGTLVLIVQSESFFDERSRNYRNKNYAVSDAGVAGNSLESNMWFDENGQVIKSSSPGSQAFNKTTYDAIGRATKVYSAYYDGVGTDDPSSISANVVLTEQESEYNDAGQVILSTSKDRLHDATGNGALNGPSSSQPKSRDSYAAMWYDEIGRPESSAYYGTNGGSAPTRPSSAPAASDSLLVSSTDFDIAGRAYQSTDPASAVIKTEFDDAGRTTKVINNFGGTDTQTVRTEYNSVGQQSKLIAENADTGNQETVYNYGVTISSGSEMASNAVLEQVTDPESGTVNYDYDRTGQQIQMTDANGSVHEYDYDDAGRRIADRVATIGSGLMVRFAVSNMPTMTE